MILRKRKVKPMSDEELAQQLFLVYVISPDETSKIKAIDLWEHVHTDGKEAWRFVAKRAKEILNVESS